MKKILTLTLSFVTLFSISINASANHNDSNLYIPTPEEIENCYQQLAFPQALALTDVSPVFSQNSTLEDNPLLLLGVISTYAENSNDISVLHTAADLAHKKLIPALSSDDYITILSNEDYTDMFKFSIMDIYSYSAKDSAVLNNANLSEVDKTLKSYIVPNGSLVVDALASIQNKSIISSNELTAIIATEDISARQMALKTMCSEYPNAAYSSIIDILSHEPETSILYRSAVKYLPRLIGNADNLTEADVLNIINCILGNSSDSFVQISCVQALTELNSATASTVLSSHLSSIPVPLVDYYNEKSDFDVISTSAVSVQPFSTTNRLGHAIYRDGVVFDQWHTGIVAHASGPEYSSDGNWVVHARGSGKTTGYDTFDTFLRNKEGEKQNYVGERYMSTMTLSDHYNIFFTAEDMATEAIPYTFVNMISVSLLAPAQLEVSDIEKIRCDGFVEFAYEYNGIKLQASSVYWDISTYLGAINHDGILLTPKTQYDTFDRTNPR